MEQISRILENQQEVKYLCYIIIKDERSGVIRMEMSTLDIYKKFKFKDENSCLSKLVDILFELKKLERWMEKKK